jgi:hypothetical protein
MNIHFCRRIVMMLHICSMFLEIGIVAVTVSGLLSELHDEHLTGDHDPREHQTEIAMTSISLALTIITFGITMLGAGDTLNGLKLAGKRISAAGSAVASRVLVLSSTLNFPNFTSKRKVGPGVLVTYQTSLQAATSVFEENVNKERG